MKKVLVSLLVLVLAMTSAFAAVDFTGEVVAGYVFQYNEDAWNFNTMGQDGIGTAPIKINAGVSDENGYWSVTFKGVMIADNRLGGNINIDLGKIIAGPDSDLSVKLGMYANNRVTGYRAYTNKSGLNLDRVRTNEEGLWANLDVAYGDLVAVQVAGGPSLQAGGNNATIDDNKYNTNFLGKAGAQLLVSAIVRPIDGLAVSAAYSYDAADSNSGSFLTAQNGAMNVEAAIDLGKMLNTDWTFGLDVADKMFFGDNFGDLFLATVYGGVDAFQLAVEYGVATQGSQDVVMPLYVGADINAVDRLLLNAYFGAKDVCTFADTWYLGANVGYEVYTGITLALNVQYATATAADFIGGDIDEFSVGAAGFSITPKMVIAF